MERPRLERQLDEAFGKRLTMVVAGAGYGKSTLLDQWTKDVTAARVTASSGDQLLSTFAGGLIEALGPLVQGADRPLLVAGGVDVARAETTAATIARWLQSRLDHDVMLIVDDTHELASAPAALRLVEGLCRQAPPMLHVLLATREVLPLRTERLRAQGALLELTGADLAFTLDEVSSLVAGSLGADGELAKELTERTGGWPAGVRLAIEALRQVEPLELASALERLGEPGSPLFSYLAQEVFEREAPETTELLRRVALFDRFTPTLCEALGLVDAAPVLRELMGRGLFIVERDGWYSLHDLMREFSLAVWPLKPDERQRLLTIAGELFEEGDHFEDALRAFAAAPDFDATRRLLLERGETLVETGVGDVVIEAASHLPVEQRDSAVEIVVGDAHLLRYEYEEAARRYEHAYDRALPLEPRIAWRLARACHLAGETRRGREVCERVSLEGAGLRDRACVHAWWATFAAQLGSIDEARALAEVALDEAIASGDDGALTDAHSAASVVTDLDGNRSEGLSHTTAALVAAERTGDVLRLGRALLNSGVELIASGACEAGITELEKTIDLVAGGSLRAKLHAIGNRGHGLRMLGRLDEARADYQTLADESGDDALHTAIGVIGLAEVWRERGNAELARASYATGLTIAQQTGFRVVELTALCGLGRSLVDIDPMASERHCRQAVDLGIVGQTSAHAALGWVLLALGDAEQAALLGREAVELARAARIPHEVAESLELVACASPDPVYRRAQLEEVLTLRRELGNRVRVALCELTLAQLGNSRESHQTAAAAERRLRAYGVRLSATAPAGLLRQIAPTVTVPVVVRTLGGFGVLRDGMLLADPDWQSRKARDLLKILIARRGRATPREYLMETLWPADDPARLANRLSVALSTLRAVLDPEKNHAADAFVAANRESIALGAHVAMDFEVFLTEGEQGLALRSAGRSDDAREHLEHAESLYAGDFLDEDPYADWAVGQREEARALYIAVTRALAEDAVGAGDADRAIRSFLRIIGRDAYDEHAHLGLVSALELAGRHGEARRAYGLYVSRMEEIGTTPAAFPAPL
jgi:ATP/maltotriose-dependent transcriptional regulator MalT/DNA-binding SARP family transcriptional activator